MTFLGRPNEAWKPKKKKSFWTGAVEEPPSPKKDKGAGKTANKKGSEGILDLNLREFVTIDPVTKEVQLNPAIITKEAKDKLMKHGHNSPCPWQFDKQNHFIYAGIPKS